MRLDVTSLIIGVERSEFMRILDLKFLKFELNFEMLTWIFPNLKTSNQKKCKTHFGCQDLFFLNDNSREAYSACFFLSGTYFDPQNGYP